MKKNLLLLLSAVLAAGAWAVDLKGSWKLNPWSGYKPKPDFVQKKDGFVSVTNITGKSGMALESRKLVPAKAGEKMKLTALVKGKGKISFRLRDYSAQKKYLRIAPNTAKRDLPADWQEITLSVKIENFKDKVTAFSAAMITVSRGGELFIKNAKMEIESDEFSGDYVFPRMWQVFAPVDPAVNAPLKEIPAKIGNVKAVPVSLDNSMVYFKKFFPVRKTRNTAWLYAKIRAAIPGKYTIGAGADYFMAIYVNGKTVLDTLKTGDNSTAAHFSNHQVAVDLEKGDNIIAVKFQSGSGTNPRISLGGANELRNLSSILTVKETFEKDDYEKPGKRSGNPQLIKDIVTDGIETLTGQGVYSRNSILRFNRTYNMPPQIGGKLFAFGLRLYKMNGAGDLTYTIGKNTKLVVARSNAKSDFTMTVIKNGKKLKTTVLPASALPSDVIFAIDANEYYVNALSLQDSKLRAINGKVPFGEKAPFTAEIKVNAKNVTVDEFFAGLAEREVKSNTVPFKIALEPEFDPVKAGWRLAWADEFNGTEVDWKNNWMNSPWIGWTHEKNRDMATVKNGKLHIKMQFKKNDKGKLVGRTTSLYSRKRFGYGYYEAKVRFTKKPGWWAAFWMLDEGRNLSAGGGYEIDIFEDYSTRNGKGYVANNLHVNYGIGNRSYGYHFKVPGSLDDFYVVGCKWTPFEVSVYINGKLVRSSSRHSPYQSVTYDGINHGFCTTTLYLSISGQRKKKGGATGPYEEDYIVDYVRAYEYPRHLDPAINWVKTPVKSCFKTGEKLVFEVDSKPSAVSKSKIKNVYLFDNGNLINYKNGGRAKFDFAVDKKHYADTVWAGLGRVRKIPVFDTYPRFFIAAVQDEKGQVAHTDIFPVIMDMGDSKPYGKIQAVPGKLDPNKYDAGGHGNAYYKMRRKGAPHPVGKEKLFSRKNAGMRECGEWLNYTFKANKAGTYDITLNRAVNRRYWELRAFVLIDGKCVGDFKAERNQETATIRNVKLSAGNHRLTLISACAYGVWPKSIDFALK